MLGRTTLVAMAFGTAAAAQELPSANRVEALVSDQLPSYWTINDLSIVATSRKGDAAQSRAVMRFEAAATAEGALFAATGNEGPFVLVSETYGAEEERTLYGFAELSYSAGEWDGGVTIENPVAELGQPSDYFQRPTLVVGTEEADQRLDALHSLKIGIAAGANTAEMQRIKRQHQEAVSELKARQTEALAELQTQHANELADAKSAAQQELASVRHEYEEKIASLKQSKEPKIAQLKAERAQALEEIRDDTTKAEIKARREEVAEHSELMEKVYTREKKLFKLKRQYQQQIANLKQSKEPMVAELRAEREEALQEVRANTEQVLQDLREQQRAKIEELKAQHAERRGQIIATQEQELAKLEKRLATKAENLRNQLETSQEILSLQEKLATSLDERRAGNKTLLAKFNKTRAQRQEFLSNLPTMWVGQGRCVAQTDENVFEKTHRLFLEISDINANSMTGSIATRRESLGNDNNYYASPITLTMKNSKQTLPIVMHVASAKSIYENGSNDAHEIEYVTDIKITNNGIMTGKVSHRWNEGDQKVEGECTMRLSS